MKMKTTLYVRCSTDAQEVEHQIQTCKKYAHSINLEINDIIKDEGVSAYSTNYTERVGLMSVIEQASKGEIKNLIIFSTDRLSRDHLQGQIIINQLTQYHVKIYSVNEGFVNGTEIDSLLNSIRFFQNQIESRKTSERIKSSKRLMAEQRRWQGNMLPFGYTIDKDKRIIVKEEERQLVLDFFQTYLNYGNTRTIKHMKDRYNIKICRAIDIIKNRTFIGYPYKAHPDLYFEELQIIPNDLWEQVQEKVKERKTKPDNPVITDRTEFLIEGIVYHACGGKMHICTDKKIYVFYKCNKCKGSYYQKSFTQPRVDKFVDSQVSNWFSQLDKNRLLEKFNSMRNKDNKEMSIKSTRLSDLLKTKRQTLKNAENKLQEALSKDYPLDMIKILTDSISELKTSINTLEEELNILDKQIENEQAISNKQIKLTEQLLDFKYLYSKATNIEKKLLIRSIVKKVIITDYDNIEIVYKY